VRRDVGAAGAQAGPLPTLYESAVVEALQADTDEMKIVPLTLDEANALVDAWHRHHRPVPGAKFCLGLSDGTAIVGCIIVGRPVARMLDNGSTLEVNRCCTNGARNACSMLYGAAWRATKALGYARLITYTLPVEGGASLRGAGWKLLGERGGGQWNVPSRPRVEVAQLIAGQKLLWEAA